MEVTASTRTEGLLTLFDMQSLFFKRAIEGVSDQDAHQRLGTPANHMAWIAGATVEQRFLMVSETEPGLKSANAEWFKDFQGLQPEVVYPSLESYVQDWDKVTPFARKALIDISDEKLDSLMDMGGMKMSYNEVMSYTIYREANFIGQLALWRRLLGYPALKYD